MLKLLSFLPRSLTKRLIYGQALLRNPFSLGVRVIVRDTRNHVLLVHHSYLPGWYLPGGGVDAGEMLVDAAKRELHEEVGISTTVEPHLLGFYLNRESFGRDHIGLFEVTGWKAGETYLKPNAEIRDARFFDPQALPPDTTRASRARITEFCLGDRPADGIASGYW
ncbi:NUDIX domain-containing protein [uncultured Roseibium sp.]|uniref:NUDIX domain-containing protein n=1 Tax=uncultured Roseibium sp. TaxID=1936171 RepID=UPI003216E94B